MSVPPRLLSHLARRTYNPVICLRTRPLPLDTRCGLFRCMSRARTSTQSPEPCKKRRLNSPPRSPPRRRNFSNMSPLLVQEVEEDITIHKNLDLTPVESTLRNLLLDVAKYIDENVAPSSVCEERSQVALPEDLSKQPIILRFTGGWVRDKLLGVPSHDIDVAINKMTGFQFGLRMKEYLEIPGNLEKYGLESIAANEKQSQKAGTSDKSKTVGGLHKIEANPEKSKHLETTTMRILGLDIDLVNLRKETYSDDSRNPQIEFGTPAEDALRRDATVNAMFYNINTEEIEDFTGRGHIDMKQKVIRTPLEPYQTFRDDPLRVLRLIRFASRLSYRIEQAALAAMGNADIKDALRRKISRERVGTEIEKSLSGPDPQEAMHLIFSLELYDTIFSDPALASGEHYTPDTKNWRIVIATLGEMLSAGGSLQQNLVRDSEEQYLAWQLAALIPYRDAPFPESTVPGKKPPPPIPVQVAREGIKATKKISELVNASVRNQNRISDVVDRVEQRKRRPEKKFEGDDAAARDNLGMEIRRWGATWRSQVVYSLLVEVAYNSDQVEAIERRYNAFVKHLLELDLMDVVSFKPLMDGKALAKAIGAAPGPWMKDALDVVMSWQLRNPGSTDPQQAIEEVKNHQTHGELTSNLIHHFLKLTIRPLFIKASPKTVTDQGRKVTTDVLPERLTMRSVDDQEVKPWKSARDVYSLDILRWVMRSLNEKAVASNWPLLIPPLLTLLDDWETKYKSLGAELIQIFLHSTLLDLLARTGLGEVFEEALLSCLTFLPSLTPEEESIPLLSSTYPTLLTLTNVRYPPPTSSSSTTIKDPPTQQLRIKALDTVLRKGIIYTFTNCPHQPRILAVIFEQLTFYLEALQLETIKHLKYLVPMLSEALSNPVTTETLPMLRNANSALQTVILMAWPRMDVWRGEIFKGLAKAWLGSLKAEEEELEGFKRDLRRTVEVLKVAAEGRCEWAKEVESLVDADSRLEELLIQQ